MSLCSRLKKTKEGGSSLPSKSTLDFDVSNLMTKKTGNVQALPIFL